MLVMFRFAKTSISFYLADNEYISCQSHWGQGIIISSLIEKLYSLKYFCQLAAHSSFRFIAEPFSPKGRKQETRPKRPLMEPDQLSE